MNVTRELHNRFHQDQVNRTYSRQGLRNDCDEEVPIRPTPSRRTTRQTTAAPKVTPSTLNIAPQRTSSVAAVTTRRTAAARRPAPDVSPAEENIDFRDVVNARSSTGVAAGRFPASGRRAVNRVSNISRASITTTPAPTTTTIKEEDEDQNKNTPTALDKAYYLLWFLLWCTLYMIFIMFEFGTVYFVFSTLFLIYLGTSTKPRNKEELSAYSVFNENQERIDGTLTAEQFERELNYRRN